MTRKLILVLTVIAVLACMPGCIIIPPVFIRNYTNDTVALVIQPKNEEYFERFTKTFYKDRNYPDSLESYISVYQTDVLLADNELKRKNVKNRIGFVGDSSWLAIILPPQSTTLCYEFHLLYPQSEVIAYIQKRDKTSQYLGSPQLPLTYLYKGGTLIPRQGGDMVFDIH
ncbi:MAG TPA: hypothetical protein VFZ47_08005 [Chitinophagaceae bacterium]